MYLGANQDQRVTLSQLADFYDVSVDHLRKIVHELGKNDHIKTYRGKNGGFELARRPKDINIGRVVAQTEGRKPMVDCDKQPCVLTENCSLKGALANAEEAFYASLSKYTLADILKDKQLSQRLVVM